MPINRDEAASPEAGFEELRAGNLGVRLALTADEIDAVQALRFRVFYREMGARADAATAAGFTVNRAQVVLDRPIKDLGLHSVSVVLHPEVAVRITLNVARSTEEAELQASGKSIRELAAEAEAAADFEIAELFDDLGGAASDDA